MAMTIEQEQMRREGLRAKVHGRLASREGYFESREWLPMDEALAWKAESVRRWDLDVKILVQRRVRGRWRFDREV